MIPVMRQRAGRAISIPQMAGGVNRRDGISFINDNQLSDGENLWHRGSVLCTRPGMEIAEEYPISFSDQGGSTQADYTAVRIHSDITKSDGELLYVLLVALRRGTMTVSDMTNGTKSTVFQFRWVNTQDPAEVVTIGSWTAQGTADTLPEVAYLCYEHEGTVYFFSNYTVLTLRDTTITVVDRENMDSGIYAPTVLTNGKPSARGGDMINAYNAIGNYYKAEYSLTNPEEEPAAVFSKTFYLPITVETGTVEQKGKAAGFAGYTVRAAVTTQEYGTVVHEAVLRGAADTPYILQGAEENFGADDLKMSVDINRGEVSFFANSRTAYTYMANNVVITAPYKTVQSSRADPEDACHMVFGMQRAAWFGGSAEGLYGGSRVFLCGNEKENYRAVICWSHRDQPTYFPVTCQSYVGATDQRVTAFGKQGNALIILKEGETYASTYMQGTTPTVEEIQNQQVLDLTSASAVFPLTLINPTIGCDCPDTVQLCRNRLVWAHSSGRVYTLVNGANTTERSIYEISEMVEEGLREQGAALKKAHAADHDGHYMLFCSNHVFVMNYNSYGYNYAHSYQKTEDANIHIPWWLWRLAEAPATCAAFGEVLLLPVWKRLPDYPGDSGHPERVYMGYLSADTDEDATVRCEDYLTATVERGPIHCKAVSKAFDFGAPALGKNVTGVHITFGYNGSKAVTVRFVSNDNRRDERQVELLAPEAYSRRTAIRYLKTLLLHPRGRAVQAMAVELESNGPLVLGPVSIAYEILGPVK